MSLLTFVLASAGILLLIHGARLFAPSQRVRDETVRAASRDLQRSPEAVQAFDTRRGVSLMQARQAIARSKELGIIARGREQPPVAQASAPRH